MALDMALNVACFSYLVLSIMAKSVSGQAVFDVTKYGAVADGTTDNAKAFKDAWSATCEHGGAASLVIPHGTFFVGPISFQGPCSNNASPTVEIQGALKAPPSLDSIPTVAWIEFRGVHGLSVGGGGVVDGQGAEAWDLTKCPKQRNCHDLPTSLRFINVSNATVANLTLLDSKGFHVSIQQSAHVTVRYLNISAPINSPNTDGIHISNSIGVGISDLTIGTGDDCISVGPGSTNISISTVVCGPGHGISVGSLGKYENEKDVVGVLVKNCTVSGTSNGVRIKTWPGSTPSKASDFTFEDIIMNNVSNPILIDQVYCPSGHCGDLPSLVKISNVTFREIRGTSKTPVAVKLMCSKSVPCDNVQLQDINLVPVSSSDSDASDNTTSSCFNVSWKGLGTLIPDLCL